MRYAASVATIADRGGCEREIRVEPLELPHGRDPRPRLESAGVRLTATVLPAQRAAPRRTGRAARPPLHPARRHEREDGHVVVRRVRERAPRRQLLDAAPGRLLLRLPGRAGSTSPARVSTESAWDDPERQVFRPPGYPAYLALFGKDKVFRGDHTAALIGQALLFGLGAFLLMLTVRRWWGENVALLGGLLYAVDPWSKHYVALVLSETLAGTVALALPLRVHSRVGATRRWTRWLGAGALAGALALVRAVFVFAPALLVLAALVRSGSDARATDPRRCDGRCARRRADRPVAGLDAQRRRPARRCPSGARATTSCSRRRGEGHGTTARGRRSRAGVPGADGPHPRAGSERRGDRCRPDGAPEVPRRARTSRCATRRSSCTASACATSRSTCSGTARTGCGSSGTRTRTGTSPPGPR